MDIRRVVTGHDDHGNAVFVSDEKVPPIRLELMPGFEFHTLWGADRTVRLPDDGTPPEAVRYFPPLGGFRVGFSASASAVSGSATALVLRMSTA